MRCSNGPNGVVTVSGGCPMKPCARRRNFLLSLLIREKLSPILAFTLFSIISSNVFSQDFTARSLGDYGNVTVMEASGNYDARNSDGSVNSAPREVIAKEFFKTHKDEYDFLVVFTNFDFQMPEKEAGAFYLGVKNDTRGIGLDLFDNTSFFGSNGELQGTIDMGNVAALVTDPLDPKFENTLYLLSHEQMHRWGAYVKFNDANGNLSASLLGRDSDHWSFLFDSGGSVLYGNRWQDNKNGTFTSTTPQGQMKFYSPLDLYLMGMISPDKVPPMLLIYNPSIDSTRLPEARVTINGTPRTIKIEDIIAAVGPRVPDAAGSQKSFKTGFIFITQPGTFTGSEIYGIENVRNGWVTRYSVLTDGKSIIEIASTPKEDLPTNPGVLLPPTTPRTVPPNIDDGVAWLMSKQQSDGSWTDDVQTVERDTAEAVHVLKNFTTAQQNYQSGLAWLTGLVPDNADYLAKKIETLADSGQDALALVQQLISMQNSDGGWGKGKDYWSNPTDTSLALKALSYVSYSDQQVISKAIGYLKSQQNPDGGWGSEDKGGMVQETSNVLSVFNAYRSAYQLDDAISRGTTWLISRQNPNGGFGNSPSTVYDTAIAVLALRGFDVPTDVTNKGLEYLLAAQAENGSWQNSAYQTALAVHAVYKATVDPDLSIKTADISFIPASVTQLPSNIVINANIWNTGRTSVSQAKVALYEGDPSTSSGQLAEQAVAFPGRQATTVTFSVTISDGNEHRYYIVVDPDNLVKESSEANNSAVSVIRPEATYDFEVLASDITVSPNPVDMFQDVKITSKITNKGTMNAYNVQVKYFIDDTGNPYELGTMTIDIPANTTVTKEVTWRANRAGTNLPVTVQADPFDNFAELSETNNKASASLTVNPVNLVDPNLTISYKDIIITPTPALERGNVNISALVKNEGFSSANNIVVNFYRGVPGPNGLLLGAHTIASLAPNESARVSIDWTNIPESGEKIIYVQVDPASQIVEIREDDNEAFTTLNILSLPDLEISASSISLTPSAPKDGDVVAITATVQNRGQQGATNVQVTAYEGSAVIGTQAISHLAGNTAGSASFSYDATGKTGVHQITVIIDPDNAITEQSENNNSASKTIGVQDANLWVSEQYFSPNGDGVKDGTQFFFRLQSPQTVRVIVVNNKNEIVRSFSGPELENTTGSTVTWDGLNEDGMVVSDGQYQVRLASATNAVLGNLSVTVDTNRSPLTDAIGTKYLLNSNLTCMLPDVGQNWQWFPDESGILLSLPYTPEYPNGIYSVSPDGADVLRLVPQEWTQGVDPAYDYSYFGYGLSPDGERIAFILNKYNKRLGSSELAQLWVVDRDGTNLTLLESYDATQARIYDFKWSPAGDHIAYRIQRMVSPYTEELRLMRADGAGKILIDSGGYFDFNYFLWSPDGAKMAYVYGIFDANRNYIEKIRVSDTAANKQELFAVYEAQYRFLHYLQWFGPQKLLLGVYGASPEVYAIWLLDPSGSGNQVRVAADDRDRNRIFIAPDNQSFAFMREWDRTSIRISDANGNVHVRNARTGGAYCVPVLSEPVWSPDGRKLSFSERLETCGDCPVSCVDPIGPRLVILDATAKELKAFANAMYPVAWLSDGVSILGMDHGSGQIEPLGKLVLLDTVTGDAKSLALSQDSRLWWEANKFISPHERYISYYQFVDPSSPCYGKGETDLWVTASLLNLTADLRAVKDRSAIILKGIAADLHFEGCRLEYADIKNPAVWHPVTPPSDMPIINDIFTTWIPPYEGTFYVRLTAWDRAGSTAMSRKRVSWGRYSSITNLYKSLEIFSPNGDEVKDTVELHYRVLEPVHLEFSIYDENDNLITTIFQDHTSPGDYYIEWDGKDEGKNTVPDGKYKIKVFDYEFFVAVDNTPPDVHLIFTPLKQTPDLKQIYSDLSGHVVDEKLKGWSIEHGEGNNPQEWFVYTQGSGPLAGEAGNNSPAQGPVQDTVISRISNQDLAWYAGKKFRIVAEDFAGNKTTRTTDFLEERILLHIWDSNKYIRIEDGVASYVRRDSDQYAINIVRTVREQIASLTVEYKKTGTGIWHESQLVTLPSAQSTGFVWDASQVNLENGDYIRIKAVDVLGAVFYSNEVWLRVLSSTEEGSLRFSLDIGYNEAGCGQISNKAFIEPTNIQIVSGKFNAIVIPKTFSVYIQKSGEYVLLRQRNIGDGSNSFIDTSGLPEGSYPIEAFIAYTVTFFEGDNTRTVSREARASGTLAVDRVLSTAQITYPTKSSMLCPVKNTDAKGDWYGLPIEGIATDNNNIQYYELYYGVGENPTAWLPATTRSNGKSVAIKETKSVQGRLGVWDVTDLHGTTYSLKLKVVDAAGNVNCYTTSFSIDTLTEISNLTIDKNLFSPNGDGAVDDVTASYRIDEYATVAVKVFKLLQGASGAVLDLTPVRTIVSGMQHLGGTESITWDGKGDAGTALPDGQYGIAVFATDSCGNTNMKWTGVEIDITLPTVAITYPKPGDPLGNIVEVKGTADDLHFHGYTLEAGQGDSPTAWTLVASSAAPVKDNILGRWNTFGLEGRWTLRLIATDAVGNKNETSVAIDLGVRKNLVKAVETAPAVFSPNNDDKREVTNINFELTDTCDIKIELIDQHGGLKRTHTAQALSAGTHTVLWDGKDDAGFIVSDNAYSVKFTAILSSNTSVNQVETITVFVDTTPPVVDIKQPGENSYFKTNITVSGTVSDQNLVEYSVSYTGNAGTVPLDQANQSRANYTFGMLNDLSEGSYTLIVRAKDLGENETNKTIAFTIDRTPPMVTLDTPKDGEYYGTLSPAVNSQQSGVIGITGSIVEKNLEIYTVRYGSGDNPAQWTELLSGSAVPVSPQLFAWGIGQGAGIVDGLYTVSLFAGDKAGSTAEARVKVTVDNTPPETSIAVPIDGDYIKAIIDIKGTAFDQNFDKYTLEISEGRCSSAYKWAAIKTATASVRNSVLAQWQALPPDGDYCLRLTAADKLGSTAEGKVNVKVDTHPPAAPVLSGSVENKTSVRLAWTRNTETDDAGYNVYRGGQKVNVELVAGSEFGDQNLAEGVYTYTVKAVDRAGWESQASNEIKIKVDLTGPDARIRSPQDGSKESGLIEIKGTAYSSDDFKQYRVYLGQGVSPTAWALIRTSPLSTSYGVLAQWDTLGLVEGAYSVKLETEDTSGNVNIHQITVTVDNTPPNAPVIVAAIASAADATVTWNANTEPDLAGYLLYRNDRLANVNGIIVGDLKPYLSTGTSYLDKSLLDGSFTYSVVAMDQAGNVSGPSDLREVTIDTHAPHATIVEPPDATKFDSKIFVKAESPDLDIASVQFQYKRAQDTAWINLGSAVTTQPYAAYLDPSFAGLTYGDYHLRAAATDKGGKTDSSPSSITVTYIDLTAPSAPQNLSALTKGQDVTFTWTANTETDLNGYNIYRADGTTRTKLNTSIITATTYQDSGLADGAYTYEATAVDIHNNESKPSNSAAAKIYAPVISQPYTPTGQNVIQVQGSNGEANDSVELLVETVAGYELRVETTADTDGKFNADMTLASGENRITAKARDAAGNTSRVSNTVIVVYNEPPSAPTGLVASVQGYDVSLTWNANTEADLAGYNLYREGEKVNAPQSVTRGDITASYSNAYDLPSLAFDSDPSTYWIGPYGSGGFGPVVWWEIKLPAPELINHVEIHWGGETYSGEELLYAGKNYEVQVWSGYAWITHVKVTGNTSPVNTFDLKPSYRTDRIRIYITEGTNPHNSQQVWISEIKILGDNLIAEPHYNDRGLQDREYNYTVTAVDYYGFESPPSDSTRAAVGDVVPPVAPQNLTAVVTGSNIVLNWSLNSEPDSAGYNVYRNTAQEWLKLNASLITVNSYTDINLPNGAYTYRVAAVDTVGNESLPSNEAAATVSTALPAPPVNLQVSPVSEGEVLNITWGYPGGSPAGYNLYRSLTQGGPYAKINTSPVTNTSYADTGLTNGTAYYYMVTALDFAANESADSNEAMGIPSDAVPPEIPAIVFPTVPGVPITIYEQLTDVTGIAEPASSVSLLRRGVLVGETVALAHDAVENFSVESGIYDAALSPNEKTLAYSVNNALWLKNIASGTAVKIAQYGKTPSWSPDGRRIAYRYTNGFYERIGIYEVETGGIYDLTSDANAYELSPSWSADGTRIAFISRRAGPWDVWIKDLVMDSLIQATHNSYADYPQNPKISPDGRKAAYFNGWGLNVVDLVNSGNTGQIDSRTDRYTLDWSPDSKNIAYISTRDGNPDIFVVDVDTGDEMQVTESPEQEAMLAWSSDGRNIIFGRTEITGTRKLWLAAIQGQEAARALQVDLYDLRYLDWLNSGSIAFLSRDGLGIAHLGGRFGFNDVRLDAGENLFHAIATDASGNVSPSSDPISVVYDTKLMPDVEVTAGDIFVYPPYPLVGKDVAINAVVRNRGQVEVKDVDVDLYLWDASGNLTLLKSERIASIAAGAGEIVEAYWNSNGNLGVNTVIAVVDPEDKIRELRETNNLAMKELTVVENENVLMSTSLDPGSYKAGQNVNIRVNLKNPGAERDVAVSVAIEDENGYPVTTFEPQAFRLAYAAERDVLFTWNTGATFAGNYRVHSVLRDTAGIVVAENTAPFVIAPDVTLDATLVTNKLAYGPRENVGISLTVSHNGTNSIVPALTARVKITDAQGVILFAEEKSITNLLPGAAVSASSPWNTGVSLPGVYSATTELVLDGQTIAVKSASFTINAVAAISGTISVAQAIVPIGGNVEPICVIENSGNAYAHNVLMSVLIIDPATQAVIDQYQDTVDVALDSGLTRQVVFPTAAYGLKTYTAVLQYSHDGAVRTLASASFTVKDMTPPAVTILSPSSGTTYNVTVPVSVSASDNAAGVDRVEYQIDDGAWKLLPVADPASGRYATTWEPTLADNGSHIVKFRATDKAGNASTPVSVSFIIQMDNRAPVTTIGVGTPKYETTGALYVGAGTTFGLAATDNFSGVARTEYRVDEGVWNVYAEAFTLAPYAEGEHGIHYRSTDNAGNAESARELKVVLDKTSPATIVTASDPLLDGVVNTVSPSTAFTLNAADNLSGVKSIVYRIDTGPWQSYTGSFNLAGLTAGVHTITCKATDNVLNEEQEKTLTIRLIVLDVTKEISSEPVVLIAAKHAEQDEDDTDEERDHRRRAVDNLERILADNGITHAAVEKKKELKEKLRSGMFNTYILMDYKKEDLEDELREAIHYGAGLILIKTKPHADPELDEVLGVKFKGKSTEKGLLITLVPSPISGGGTLRIDGERKVVRAEKVSPTTQILGYVEDKKDIQPVILLNQYGRGKAILFGFDLLNCPDQAMAAELVLNSVNYVKPDTHPTTALDSVFVRIRVSNSAEPAGIRVTETLPSDTVADTVLPAAIETERTITWEKSLSSHETALFGYYLTLPDAARVYTATTEIRYSNNGEYRLYGDYGLTLTLNDSPAELLQRIIAELNGAAPLNEQDAHGIKEIIKNLSSLSEDTERKASAERNIDRILRAIDEARELSIDATEIRLKLDELLRMWAKKWYPIL